MNCIATLAIPDGKHDLSQLCAIASMRDYAERVRADLRVIRTRKYSLQVPNQFMQWDKWQAFEYCAEYEQVLYMDSDVIVHPRAENVFAPGGAAGGAPGGAPGAL